MGDGGDEEMVDFLQRLIGYTLCGDAVERIMVEMYGPTGSNGKSGIRYAATSSYRSSSSVLTRLLPSRDAHDPMAPRESALLR